MTPRGKTTLASAIVVLLAAAIVVLALKINAQRQWQKELDALVAKAANAPAHLVLDDLERLIGDNRPNSSQRTAAKAMFERTFSEHISSGRVVVKIDGRLAIDHPAITKRSSPAFIVQPGTKTLEIDLGSAEFAQLLAEIRLGSTTLQKSSEGRFTGEFDFSTIAEPQSLTFLPRSNHLAARSLLLGWVVDAEAPAIQLTIDGQPITPDVPHVSDCTIPVRLRIDDETGIGQGMVETRRGNVVDFSNRISKRSTFLEISSLDTLKRGRIEISVSVSDVAGNSRKLHWMIDRLEPKHPELESWNVETLSGTIDLLRRKIAYVTSESLEFSFSIRPGAKTEFTLGIGERGKTKSEHRIDTDGASTFKERHTLPNGISAFEIELRSTLASTKDMSVLGRAELVLDREGPRVALLDGTDQAIDASAVKIKKGSDIVVVVDDDHGLVPESVTVDGGPGADVQELGRRAEICRFRVSVKDGTSIKIAAKDVAGNETKRTIPVDVVADSTGPGVSVKFRDRLLADAAPLFFGSTPRLEVSIADPNGVKEKPTVKYVDGGLRPAQFEPLASTASEMNVAFDAVGEFDLTVSDAFGNRSQRRYKIEVLDPERFRVEDAAGRPLARSDSIVVGKNAERLRFGFPDAYPGLSVGVRARRTTDSSDVDLAVTDGKLLRIDPDVLRKGQLELAFFVDAVDGRIDLSRLIVRLSDEGSLDGEKPESRPTSAPRESESVRVFEGRSRTMSRRASRHLDFATSAVSELAPPTVARQGARPLVRHGSLYA